MKTRKDVPKFMNCLKQKKGKICVINGFISIFEFSNKVYEIERKI